MKRFAVVVLVLSVLMLVACGKETTTKKVAAPAKPESVSSFTPPAETGKKPSPEPQEQKLAPPAPPGPEKAAGEEKAIGKVTTAEEKKTAEEPKAVVEKKAAVEEK